MNQYEAMYLFDPTFGQSWENCENEVRRLMDRAGAELLFCKKWDERRLAYPIRGRKRGVYVLTYFRAAPEKISGIERDAQISEAIIRALVVRADDVTPELMERAMQYPAEAASSTGWGGRGEGEPAEESGPRRRRERSAPPPPAAHAEVGAAAEVGEER